MKSEPIVATERHGTGPAAPAVARRQRWAQNAPLVPPRTRWTDSPHDALADAMRTCAATIGVVGVDYRLIVGHAVVVVDTRDACGRAGLRGDTIVKA